MPPGMAYAPPAVSRVCNLRRNPGALKRGATMLVGRPSDAEGDVDWDTPAAPAAQADA
jgi:hypothetical protein